MSTGTFRAVDAAHLQCSLPHNLFLLRIVVLPRFLGLQAFRPGLHPLLLRPEMPLALCRDRCRVLRASEVRRLSLVQLVSTTVKYLFYS